MGDETDVDDESMQFVRTYHRRRGLEENETTQSSTLERHDTSATQSRLTSSPIDDEPLLTRKQSKIGKSSSALPKRQVRSRSINRQQHCRSIPSEKLSTTWKQYSISLLSSCLSSMGIERTEDTRSVLDGLLLVSCVVDLSVDLPRSTISQKKDKQMKLYPKMSIAFRLSF